MSLSSWRDNGWLVEHKATPDEVRALFAVAARDRKHHWTIQSLAHTIGADPKLIARFDAFRKKRNVGDYERAGATSPKEAEEMRVLARQLGGTVRKWLEESHPDLLKINR